MKNEGYPSLSQNSTYIDLRGITTISNKLSLQDYIKYRTVTENDQPLQYELYLLGLGYIPKYLQRWHHMNKVIKEVVDYRDSSKSMTPQDFERLNGVLAIEEMMFILQNCDIPFTKPEVRNDLSLMLFTYTYFVVNNS